MYLYELREEGRLSADEMAEILLNVESFLVRRLLVGVSTKNLNRIFAQIVGQLRQMDPPVLDAVRYQLSTERKFWASDAELQAAAAARPFYYYGRAEQAFGIRVPAGSSWPGSCQPPTHWRRP